MKEKVKYKAYNIHKLINIYMIIFMYENKMNFYVL